jgi:hypothetical protein
MLHSAAGQFLKKTKLTMKTTPVLLLVSLFASTSFAQVTTLIDDFDSNRTASFVASTGTTANRIDFDTADSDFELNLTRTSNTGFQQYAQTFIARNNTAFFTSFSTASSLQVDIIAFNGGNLSDFAVRWSVSADSWTSGSGNYRAFSSTTVATGADRRLTLTLNLETNPSVVAAALNYRDGAGTFFGLVLDNSGFPTNANPINFAIENVRLVSAIPEPSAFAVLAGVGVLGLAAARRRRA